MKRDEAKEYLKEKLGDYLESTGRSTKQNINCINPEHEDRNPSMSYDAKRNKLKCFACEVDYDLFDVIGIDYDLKDFNAKLNQACELYGIELEGGAYESSKPQNYQTERIIEPADDLEPLKDHRAYLLEAHANIHKTDYPQQRGLTEISINKFKLGYDAEWKSPTALEKDKNPVASPRLIIPSTVHSYLARDVRDDADSRYSKMKEGTQSLFNYFCIHPDNADKPDKVFITEGEFDAMSIIEAGHEAVALRGINNIPTLIKEIKEYGAHRNTEFYVLLDNDPRGNEATVKLITELDKLKATAYPLKLEDYKDPNDMLMSDREGFKALIKDMLINPKKHRLFLSRYEEIKEFIESPEFELSTINDVAPDVLRYLETNGMNEHIDMLYRNTSAGNHIKAFIEDIARVATPPISTGFNNLDKVLGGGLYEGLYFIGAISSLGKTTLALQIADNVASSGADVLFFSLEMSRYEIMAKTISRLTYTKVLEDDKPVTKAKTTRGITDYSRYQSYDAYEKELITESIKRYNVFANNIYIYQGVGNIGVEEVRNAITKHTELTGKAPIVMIDYLQILSPYNERATDKQNTDKAVLELKRISRDFKTPVIAISSFNRENYTKAVSMVSFKESGAIEYSADVVIGLQFNNQNKIEEHNKNKKSNEPVKVLDHDAEKQKEPREIELKILKNRNGRTGESTLYNYYPKFNYYDEVETHEFDIKVKSDKVAMF